MPLYEYRCPKCSDLQDHHHAIDDSPPDCAKCGWKLERSFGPQSGPKTTNVKGSRIGECWFDEREVHALHGKNWRQTAKNPTREGGDRKAIYFHD